MITFLHCTKKLHPAAQGFIRQAFTFFCEKYGLDINLNISTHEEIRDNLIGYCTPLGDKSFNIDLATSGKNQLDLVCTLFHELWHVKQIMEGNLYFDKEDPQYVVWRGKRYMKANELANYSAYYKQPWERSAERNGLTNFMEFTT